MTFQDWMWVGIIVCNCATIAANIFIMRMNEKTEQTYKRIDDKIAATRKTVDTTVALMDQLERARARGTPLVSSKEKN